MRYSRKIFQHNDCSYTCALSYSVPLYKKQCPHQLEILVPELSVNFDSLKCQPAVKDLFCTLYIQTETNQNLLRLTVSGNNTGLQKKFPRTNFQDSVMFSPAEYEYESRLFPSRPDFPKFYDKGLNINKIGCLQVVFLLKLTNKINVLHT